MSEIDYFQLLREMKIAAGGNVRRLAAAVGVTEPTIRAWLGKSESELGRLQQDNKDAIVRAARHFHLEPIVHGGLKSLWDLNSPYGANLRSPAPNPPALPPEPAIGPELFGKRLLSPFGAAASLATSTAERIRFLAATGCGVITYKTVRSCEAKAYGASNVYAVSPHQVPFQGGDTPRRVTVDTPDVFSSKNGLVNRYGAPSPLPQVWMDDVRTARTYLSADQILVVSVLGTTRQGGSDIELIEDFVGVASMAADAGADVIEINASCPTCAGREHLIQEDLSLVKKICAEVRNAVAAMPLLIKITYLPERTLTNLVHETLEFVQGYSAINALPVEAIFDGQGGPEPVFGDPRTLGALSGPLLLSFGLQIVSVLSRLRDRERLDYRILGMGGVATEADVGAYLKAGADVVQAANVFFHDSLFALKVLRYLIAETRGLEGLHERQRWLALANAFTAHQELVNTNAARALSAASVAVLLDWQDGQTALLKAGPRKALPPPSVAEFKRLILEKLNDRR